MNRFVVLLMFAGVLESGIAVAETRGVPAAVVVEGAPFEGRLVAAEAPPASSLRFDVAGQSRQVPLAGLVMWGALVEPSRGLHVVLADGGVIVADKLQVDEDRLRGESALVGKLDLPLKLVAGIVFRPPLDRAKLDQLLARVVQASAQADRVLLDNGDELTGTLAELTSEVLRLESDAGKVDVEVSRLSALIFNAVLVEKPKPVGLRVLVGLSDGSRVTAISLAADEKAAQLKLAGGAELAVETSAIVALQPLGGSVVYLSDLKPASYRHLPFLQLAWDLSADRSVLGGRLRAGGHVYAKGLGMHSPARVTYDLPGAFRRFESELAVDAESGDRGSVVFRVFTDDGSGWREAAASQVVRGGEPPVAISADLAGAKRISLLVDFADHGDELDHADWLGARLVR